MNDINQTLYSDNNLSSLAIIIFFVMSAEGKNCARSDSTRQ
jgi:hypothetical protein